MASSQRFYWRHVLAVRERVASPKPIQPRQMRETFIPVEPNRTYSMSLLLSNVFHRVQYTQAIERIFIVVAILTSPSKKLGASKVIK